jgi:hypothetical protein
MGRESPRHDRDGPDIADCRISTPMKIASVIKAKAMMLALLIKASGLRQTRSAKRRLVTEPALLQMPLFLCRHCPFGRRQDDPAMSHPPRRLVCDVAHGWYGSAEWIARPCHNIP